MTLLYDLLYALALLLGWPYLIYRRLTRGPGSLAIGERLGRVPSRPVASHCVWIHGVSLGEINAARTIVAELRQRSPETAVVVSSTTQTGLQRARELFGARCLVFRFPIDFSFIMRRVLERVRPSVIVLMELETWPNLIEVAAQRGIPVTIANGRVTQERTLRGLDRPVVRRLARRMFSQVRWVGVQDEVYAERFRRLGVPNERVEVCGSVKYDAADITERIPGQDELAGQMTIDAARPLWACGSTGPGEEELLLGAYAGLLNEFHDLQLALVPRKPERFDEVAELILRRGFTCLRRSGKPPLVPPDVPNPRAVFLGDTLGELRKFYALATIVFVGRSLVPLGGSDLIEAGGLGKPILIGPYTQNFAEAAELLVGAGACLRVESAAGLESALRELLKDAGRRERMGKAAQAAIVSRRGATARIVERILEFGKSL